jgi:hypothetical protein
MFDELERLCNGPELQLLLARYAEGAADRETWQDRLMHIEGLDARGGVKLHGELLAYGWVEQNTGNTPVLRSGEAPCSYRITSAGLRALRQARSDGTAEDDGEASPAAVGSSVETATGGGSGAPRPKRRERRRTRAAPVQEACARTPESPELAAGTPAADLE